MPPGTLYIVATPIGNLSDITARALETLGSVDLILCEDTRVSRKLLAHFNIKTRTESFHQHSSLDRIEQIVSWLSAGKNLALITDAGTPGIADPGGKLAAAVVASAPTTKIIPIPGASALTAALSICSFDAQQFVFCGWPPHKKGRDKYFRELAGEPRVVVFYESVYRIKNCLERIVAVAPNRQIMLARELTKKFETIYRGTASEILSAFPPEQVKGEFVVVMNVISTDTSN